MTPKDCREKYQRLFDNEPLLNGDLTALERFLYSNEIQVRTYMYIHACNIITI